MGKSLAGMNIYDLNVLVFTIKQAFFSTILSIIIAILPTIYASKYKNKISNILNTTFIIPFYFPSSFAAVSFTVIIYNIYKKYNIDLFGEILIIVIAHAFYNSPIFIKYVSEALQKIPIEIIELAQIDGVTSHKKYLIFMKIIKSSILRAIFLIFIFSFTSLSIIIALGNGKLSTLEVEIVKSIELLDLHNGLKYLIMQSTIFLVIYKLLQIIEKNDDFSNDIKYQYNSIKPRFYENIISYMYILFESIPVLIPIIFTVNKISYFFNNIKKLDIQFNITQSVINSMLLSTISAIIIIILAYILIKLSYDTISMLPLFISTAFWGILFIYLQINFNISNLFIAICGFSIINIPLAYNILRVPVKNIKNEIIEAAKIDGANSINLFLKIEFQLLKEILFATFFQIFSIVLGEFTFAYMIASDSFPIFSITTFKMMEKRFIVESVVLNVLMLIVIIIFYIISSILISRNEKNML